MKHPTVGRISIHPVKGLDAIRVTEATVLASGALALDRRWAFVDSRGRFVSGKTWPGVHKVRAEYDLGRHEIALDGRVFSLDTHTTELEGWVSNRLNERVELREDREVGFPDDTASPGPTCVSERSLARVAEWFGLSVDSARLRFRTNIEWDGTDAFWEDRLYGRQFRLGRVRVDAINPCQRCVVPTRDARTGDAIDGFQKRFAQLRQASLPAEANPVPFDHFYRLAVNTRIPASEAGKIIREGDAVAFGG